MSNLVVVPVLGVLIFVHELGHFLAAKAVGIGVARFSIGLGPITPLRFQRGETEYVISWVPFGGYVKMASQEELDELEALEGGQVEKPFPPEKLFESKPLAARVLVISAGVVMNAVFAWLVYSWIAYTYGGAEYPTTTIARVVTEDLPESARAVADLPFGARIARVNGQEVQTWGAVMDAISDPRSDEIRLDFADGMEPLVLDIPGVDIESRIRVSQALVPLLEARVGDTESGGPADEAGLRTGDLVKAIDGEDVRSWEEMVAIVQKHPGTALTFSVDRDGSRVDVPVTPVEATVKNQQTGESSVVGQIGISLWRLRIRYEPMEALVQGYREAARNVLLVFYTIKGMMVGAVSVRELGGPVLITQVSAQAARLGFEAVLLFTAFLSINLAILNLLPIPVLDGGHLVFLFLEGLRGGRPVPRELRHRLTLIGFYFLMVFMLLVVVNDFLR